jgi:D-amino-acid dehydrogenase
MILLTSLFLDHQALRFKFWADPRLYAWSWLFLMDCTLEKARRNTLLKRRLATYSQSVLGETVADEEEPFGAQKRRQAAGRRSFRSGCKEVLRRHAGCSLGE